MLNLAALTAGIDRPLGTPEETRRPLRLPDAASSRARRWPTRPATRRACRPRCRPPGGLATPSSSPRRWTGGASCWRIEARGDRRGRPAPRRAHRAAAQRRRPAPPLRGPAPGDRVLPAGGGAHVSATAFARTVDHLLRLARRPSRGRRAAPRRPRCSCSAACTRRSGSTRRSPTGMRWALADVTLQLRRDPGGRQGRHRPDGGQPGPRCSAPTPPSSTPAARRPRLAPFGLSFASGMHVCIGQDLAAGLVPGPCGAMQAAANTSSAW